MEQPHPATLTQALGDISCNRLVAVVLRHPWLAAGLTLATAVLLVLYAPDDLSLLLVPPAFLLVALVGYFAAAWPFAARVRKRRPRCPSCKNFMWQLQCGHCRQPVPLLALLYRGWFLAHCPHCGRPLSDEDGSLQAWCHTCGETQLHPQRHLHRPCVIAIELGNDLPKPPPSWQDRATGKPYQELHRGDDRAYTILYQVTHDADSMGCLPVSLMAFVTSIWIGRGVNPLARQTLLGSVPLATRRGARLYFEDTSPPAEVHAPEYRALHTGAPRPASRSGKKG